MSNRAACLHHIEEQPADIRQLSQVAGPNRSRDYPMCENSEFGLFWSSWFLDVDLSDLQLNEIGHKFGAFSVLRSTR